MQARQLSRQQFSMKTEVSSKSMGVALNAAAVFMKYNASKHFQIFNKQNYQHKLLCTRSVQGQHKHSNTDTSSELCLQSAQMWLYQKNKSPLSGMQTYQQEGPLAAVGEPTKATTTFVCGQHCQTRPATASTQGRHAHCTSSRHQASSARKRFTSLTPSVTHSLVVR